MDIWYLGHSSFRLKGKTATVVTDPFDPKMVGMDFPKVEADIVTVSHDHRDHNQSDQVKGVKKVIKGPGEYEINGVSIVGIKTYHDSEKGEKRGKNTIYVFEIDDLRLAHLGDLGTKLSEKQIESMGEIDVLFIPIGGEYTINAQVAAQVARDIEPVIIVPMHYMQKGLKKDTFAKLTDEKPFINDLGLPVENEKRLNIRKLSLGEEQKIVIMERK
ncbi:MBL fold metallo-hydrolase [Candidatus Woesebacteria bacterium]|nr:MBL fold metallo-hydrolase [Candidatus Woesebacteria bacterium]